MLHALVLAAAMTPTPSMGTMSGSHGRYYGQPNLTLTTQMIEAGGGPTAFSSKKLFAYLAGSSTAAEAASLTKRFGATNIDQFFKTFDAFVHLAVVQVQKQHIALPKVTVPKGPELAGALYAAGVMPDGRFDVGYMLEHLLSRPMHVTLMHEANASSAVGPQNNAEFHIILTSAMHDLHTLYSK